MTEPGALPAQTGGAMYLEAQLEKPAFVYLVWIDATGKAKPLYPWNNEKIEVTDFDQAPPVRRATNRVFSPLLGRDWALDGPPGLETILLLVRETALPQEVKLSDFFADLPSPPRPAKPDMVASYVVHAGGNDIAATDEPFKTTLTRLAKHFDLIQAIRFAHEDPK